MGGLLDSAANRVATLNRDHVRNLALLALAFGLVEAVEAVGLWLERRWAEYLTVVATAGLLPFELAELAKQVTPVRVGALVLNLAVVAYLVAWVALATMWRGKEINLTRAYVATLVLTALGFLGTFPIFYDLFTAH